MNKKFLTFAAVALVLAACSSEEPIAPPMVENDAMGANPYRVSLTDALKNADALLGELGEGETTRSAERKVESVEYYSRPGTRALGGDTLLYLVNYADDAGFALLSADSRLRPIYAISEEGSMSFSDTTYNKGLALFARGVEAEIESSLTIPNDTAIFNPPTIPEEDVHIDTLRSIRDRVSPMLTYYQRYWDQDSPFNRYCFTSSGAEAKVGCTAVAAAQIMSYYNWPQQYLYHTFNWDEINAGNIDMLARFLRVLGNSENLNIHYAPIDSSDGSYASISNFYRTFDNMGYTYHSTFQNFNEAEVCAFLKGIHSGGYSAGPILVDGRYPNNDGHSWVIDGYLQYNLTILTGESPIFTSDDILYHCVWGWGAKNNGYYYWAKRQRFDSEIIEQDRYDDSTEAPWEFLYFYNIKYMAGFAPQSMQ